MTVLPPRSRPRPVRDTVADDARRYWAAASALAGAHAFGLSWPPPGTVLRTQLLGHWGCNPGIAWTVGHLAATHHEPRPPLVVVGTGHATGFLFAHDAVSRRLGPAEIGAAIARYGRPGGEPTETVGQPGLPYLGGELGPALGVTQGLAMARPGLLVVAVIGDGEVETPAALAALAHHRLVTRREGVRWLPVINANGARMGGPAAFGGDHLARLLTGMGFEVLRSGSEPDDACAATTAALDALDDGRAAVWLSQTEKGWPAPDRIAGRPFRGAAAHKPGAVARDAASVGDEVGAWLAELIADGLVDADGRVAADIAATAARVTLQVPAVDRVGVDPPARTPPPPPSLAPTSPMAAVDELLMRRGTLVISPDEASSNRLARTVAADACLEVLAEELCSAWTWGLVEGGREAVLVTYEAFAPLLATQVAQHHKLVSRRPSPGGRPFVVLETSLGWANSPTHQNSDLVATYLARADTGARAVAPVGATSTARRLEALLDLPTSTTALVVASKQPLPDLPDPGGPALRIRRRGAATAAAVLVVAGDVVVSEAIAALVEAAEQGVVVEVVALVELSVSVALPPDLADVPVVAAAWCAPHHVAPVVHRCVGRVVPVSGHAERWGATPWETLCANGLDRGSLLRAIGVATDTALTPAGVAPRPDEALPPVDLSDLRIGSIDGAA